MKCDKLKSITAYELTTNTDDSDVYIHNDEFACGGDAVQVYRKSDVDHILQHANYKRCVAMSAYWLAVRYKCIDEKHRQRAAKNNKRWLELSKRYKESK